MKNKIEIFYLTSIFFYYFIVRLTCEHTCLNESSTYLKYFKSNDNTITYSFFTNFENLSEIRILIECNENLNITDYLTLMPLKPFLIDNSIKSLNKNRLKKIHMVSIIHAYGIDTDQNSTFVNSNDTIDRLLIFYSKLNIYSDNVLTNSKHCNLNNRSNEFFNSFLRVIFIRVSYPTEWCPHFFKSSSLIQIYFGDIVNSFLYKNRLNFIQLNGSSQLKGLKIKQLKSISLNLNYEILTSNILYSYLFMKIREFNIEGVLNGFEESIFKEFNLLESLDLTIDNLEDFFHSGMEWMKFLNYNIKKYNLSSNIPSKEINRNLLLVRFQYQKKFVSFEPIYEYPNEDICIFKNFPHNRLVYPIISPGKKLKCTCTLLWLQSYSYLYRIFIQNISDYDQNYQIELSLVNRTFIFCNSSYDLLACDFNEKFKNCKIDSIEMNTNTDNKSNRSFTKLNNDIDIFFLIKWLQFILLIVLQPVLCFTGMISNLFIILVIKNKAKKKEFNHAMYQFALLNSFFNAVYCVIVSFKLINTCVFYGSSVFCSSLYQTSSAQYFKIIFIFYIGNVFKMCSNLSYMSFTISRLIVITFYTDNAIPRFSLKKLVIFFFIFIFSSLVLNTFKIFQYGLNTFYSFREDFPLEIRDKLFCEKKENQFQCNLFNGFKISYRFLNDILFVLVNLIIDLVLIKRFRHQMDLKALQVVDLDHHKRIRQSKANLNRLVLTNSIIYVISHLPEFISSLLLVLHAKRMTNFCVRNLTCDLINEEAEFFGLISVASQFFIFLIFDKNFKASFIELGFFSFVCRREVNRPMPNIQPIELRNINRVTRDG
jgi:hypothetical protein